MILDENGLVTVWLGSGWVSIEVDEDTLRQIPPLLIQDNEITLIDCE